MATEIDNFSLYSIAQLYFFLNSSSIGNSCTHKIVSIEIRVFCIFAVCEQAVIKAAEYTVLVVGKVHLISFIVLKSSRC